MNNVIIDQQTIRLRGNEGRQGKMRPGHAPAEEEADDQSSSNEAGQGPWDHDCSCNSN